MSEYLIDSELVGDYLIAPELEPELVLIDSGSPVLVKTIFYCRCFFFF